VAFTYSKVKSANCLCLLPVVLVLVLRFWSCLHHWDWEIRKRYGENQLTRSSRRGSRCERRVRSRCSAGRVAADTRSTPDRPRASCCRPPTGSAGRVSAPCTRNTHGRSPPPPARLRPRRPTGSSRPAHFRCANDHVDRGRAAAVTAGRVAARRRMTAVAHTRVVVDDGDDDALARSRRYTTSSLRHRRTLITRRVGNKAQ